MNCMQKLMISFVLMLGSEQVVLAGQQAPSQSQQAQLQQRKAQAQQRAQQAKAKAQASGKTLPNSGQPHHGQQASKGSSQSSGTAQPSQPSKLNTNDLKTKLFLDEKTGQVEGIQVSMGKCSSSKTSEPNLSQGSIQQLIKSITETQKKTLKITK